MDYQIDLYARHVGESVLWLTFDIIYKRKDFNKFENRVNLENHF